MPRRGSAVAGGAARGPQQTGILVADPAGGHRGWPLASILQVAIWKD